MLSYTRKNKEKINKIRRDKYKQDSSKPLARANKYYKNNKDTVDRKRNEHYHRSKHTPEMRTYRKNSKLKYDFGITLEQYNQMIANQRGVCAICKKPFSDKTPHVDHCHKTGKIRGIVHPRCNLLLGMAGDDVELLQQCIIYLKETA